MISNMMPHDRHNARLKAQCEKRKALTPTERGGAGGGAGACPAGLVSVTNQFGVVCLRFKKSEQAHEFVRACREFLGKGGGR